MGKIVIHIGFPKTGTTSIQAFLYKNRKLLRAQNIYYEMFSKSRDNIIRDVEPYRNGTFLDIDNPIYEKDKTVKKLITFIDKSTLKRLSKNNHTALFSYENLSLTHTVNWPSIVNLLKKSGFGEVSIIVYIRPQDSFLLSSWKMGIKAKYQDYNCDFNDYYKNQDWKAYYYIHLEEIEKNLESFQSEINVRIYDRNRFEGGDIYHDFCSAIGCKWDPRFEIPQDVNTTTTLDVTEALRIINKMGYPGIHDNKEKRNRIMRAAEGYSREHPETVRMYPLAPDKRRELMNQFIECNNKLAERYLKGSQKDIVLGWKAASDYVVWQPDEEKAESIAAEILSEPVLKKNPMISDAQKSIY